jgi:hypothetical protein
MRNRIVAACLPLFLPFLCLDAATIRGTARDTTGALLPGVTVEVTTPGAETKVAVTDGTGQYSVDVPSATYDVTFRLINFSSVRRTAQPKDGQPATVDVALPLEASASIVVTGKQTFQNLADLDEPVNGLIGIAEAASVGVITATQLDARAEQRPGNVLETIPGVVISQHSGEGKANQYYLRGFNLDHGTDFATTVAGAPVNMPTHAHGQGYADINFLIPELISGVQYKKGPYYADEGDFSSAGAANVNYVNFLERPVVALTGGNFGYSRVLTAGSRPWASGLLLGALEVSRNDGPWERPDDYRKVNGLARFTGGSAASAYSVTLGAYHGGWNSTDQVPDRAVRDGGLSRFGSLDTSSGGESYRYSAVGDWQHTGEGTLTKANAYVIGYGLDLFSNFTYFLDDPENGDQFEQVDRRVVGGGRITHQWLGTLFGASAKNMVGLDVRHDHIGDVGLYRTRERERLSTVRDDRVFQTSAGVFAQSTIQWHDKFRSVLGLRTDTYFFDVDAGDPANGGTARTSLVSPKVSLVFGPWRNTELYLGAATGFHSNDGRGATLTVDPSTGEPAESVDPLVRTRGAEVGIRTTAIPRLQTTFALWRLDVASELLFVGDAGGTEASRPSRRMGFEWSNYYRVSDHVVLDADLAYSRARFADSAAEGSRIPGALEGVVSTGVSLYDLGRFSGSLRYRYLGPRPLLEDNSVRSAPSHLTEASFGFAVTPRYRIVLDALNLFDSRVSDIEYYYTSRLPGEPMGGVTDLHSHPVEPRSARLRFVATF